MNWIQREIDKIIKRHKTNCPFEISDQKNIHVVHWDLHEEIWGFYRYERRNRFIFINDNLDFYLKRYVCAHELGHAVLHTKINTPFLKANTFYSVDRIEREANEFAVNLLLCNENLQDYETKYDLMCKCGIPYEMERLIS